MKKVALIDADALIFGAGSYNVRPAKRVDGGWFVLDKDDCEEAIDCTHEVPFYEPDKYCFKRIDKMISGILRACKTDKYEVILSTDKSREYRSSYYPEYKLSRTQARPPYYVKIRDHLVKKHKAELITKWEADDEVALRYAENLDKYIICSTDKDVLYMIPGDKYDYSKKRFVSVSETEAWKNFFLFVLSGDKADNIPGLKGFGEPEFDEEGKVKTNGKAYKAIKKEIDYLIEHNDKIVKWKRGNLCGMHELLYHIVKRILLKNGKTEEYLNLVTRLLFLPRPGMLEKLIISQKVYKEGKYDDIQPTTAIPSNT